LLWIFEKRHLAEAPGSFAAAGFADGQRSFLLPWVRRKELDGVAW